MVTILKEYIHAESVRDWNEHLASVEKMLHSFCTTHKVHDISLSSLRAVHHLKGKFNGVRTDKALEKTCNIEGKTLLLKGISQALGSREKIC